jgi:aldehyde:ferredoxin oxidoreductase
VVHLDEMLAEYYRFRGWTQDGVPTPKKIAVLGLDELAKEQPHA